MNYTERDTYSMHTTNVFGNGPGPTLMGSDTLIGNDVYNKKGDDLF